MTTRLFQKRPGQYLETNRAKAAFEDIYRRSTPHAYFSEMRRLGYQIGEQARPYCIAAAQLIARAAPAWPVQMLDVGCSYGVGSAFVRYGCSFEELVSFFDSRAPTGYHECTAATRTWLNVVAPALDMRVVGLDASGNAIRFGLDAGLLDAGISRDLECEDPSGHEQAWLAGCNLLICTGAIGYVGRATFDRILAHLGTNHPGGCGSMAVMTVLRMFDPCEVGQAFEAAGYAFEHVGDVRLPQRGFADESEQQNVLTKVRARGLDTRDVEERGVLYADLYIAGVPELQPRLRAAMDDVRRKAPIFSRQVQVAHACASARNGASRLAFCRS
ncbi:MAG: hypothetical protein MJD61_08305 [Proteobacteria bacterium]|nr:hypothetical protein [Pseudomonadota bacterium]